MMRFRLPSPLHGWKEFLNEIFIIVLGVLIALGFGQVAEDWSWQQKARDGDARLRVELRNLFGHAAEQVIVQPCILAQLDGLRTHLAGTGRRTTPMPFDRYPNNLAVLRVPTRPWSNTIWQALQQDGTATHFPVQRQRYLGVLYSQVETMRGLIMQTGDAAGQTLATGYSGPLDSEIRSALMLTVAEQYRRSQYMTRIALQIMGTMRDLGYAPSDAELSNLLKRTNISSNTIGFCRERGLPLADWKTELKTIPNLSQRPM